MIAPTPHLPISRPTRRYRNGLACAALVLLAACGGSDDHKTELSATIDAGGGTLTSTDGRLKLTIPAGALGNPTEITISEVATDAGTLAYALAPDGLVFATPAMVELDVSTLTDTTPGAVQPLVGAFRVSGDGSEVAALGDLSATVDTDAGTATLTGTLAGFSTLVGTRLKTTYQVAVVPNEVPENSPFPAQIIETLTVGSQQAGETFSLVEFSDSSVAPVLLSGNARQTFAFNAEQTSYTVSRAYNCGAAGSGLHLVFASLTAYQPSQVDGLLNFVSDPTTIPRLGYSMVWNTQNRVQCTATAGGVDDTDGGGTGGGDVLDIDISNGNVAFDHSVGQTECPQSIGSFTVTNSGTVAVTVHVEGGPVIAVGTEVFVLQPGESAEVPLVFLCTQTSNVNSTIAVTATDANGNQTQGSVTVTGSVG